MQETPQNTSKNEQDDGDLFTAPELIFIDSIAAGLSVQASAEKSGFSYMTGRRYYKRPDIKRAIRERAAEAVQAGGRVLSQRASGAAKSLADMAEEKTDANPARVAACKAVLEIGIRIVEIDGMADRLEAVEAQLAANAKAGM